MEAERRRIQFIGRLVFGTANHLKGLNVLDLNNWSFL
jgi:hypothetical protein